VTCFTYAPAQRESAQIIADKDPGQKTRGILEEGYLELKKVSDYFK
jgi:hypothetical protein